MFISLSDEIGVIVLVNSSNYNPMIQIENAVFDVAEETNFITVGDINFDSLINIQDVVLLINLVLSEVYDNVADLNKDNILDILDIVQLVNIILN